MLTLLLSGLVAATPIADAERGTVVFYRGSTVWGAAGACPIRHEGREVVELGRGKFAEWKVRPGRYVFTNKRSSVEVNVASGETRYVRCQIRSGMLGGGAELQIVDQADFEKRRADFERKEMAEQPGL